MTKKAKPIVTVQLSQGGLAKFLRRTKNAGLSQSEVARVAFDEFFAAHPTSTSIIDAVIKRRSVEADRLAS